VTPDGATGTAERDGAFEAGTADLRIWACSACDACADPEAFGVCIGIGVVESEA
jgi:hypothetical protein